MKDKLAAIRESVLSRLETVNDLKEWEDLRVNTVGKKSELSQLLKGMGALSPEERPQVGKLVNDLRELLEARLTQRRKQLEGIIIKRKLSAETIDVTMPGTAVTYGGRHPMTIVIDDLKKIFIGMGYEIAEGPDVETEFYNFTALNMPPEHPARDEQDTFYVEGGFPLRTATSPVQVRAMEKTQPPIRVIVPGRVFRSDEVDATHSPVFHQLEGLVVDRNITMGDLKGSLEVFAKTLFGSDTKVRFRPHYFPFTEPSAEMDVSCFACGGKGCRVCKDEGFIEILGCGMVHPKVLSISGIDPEVYTGFAFGMGLERIAMQRYGITDMRLMFENDVKFLSQF